MLEREMRPVVFEWCKSQNLIPVCEVLVQSHMADIVAVSYHPRVGNRVPVVKELVGLELKLSDTKGVLRQCSNLKYWCHRVYAVMPRSKCLRIRPDNLAEFTKSGVGLLMHDETKLEELLAPELVTPTAYKSNFEAFQKNLWRRIRSGKTYFTPEQTAVFSQSRRKYKELLLANAATHKAMLDQFLANHKEPTMATPEEPKPPIVSETWKQYRAMCDKLEAYYATGASESTQEHETLMADLDKLWDSLTPAEQGRE